MSSLSLVLQPAPGILSALYDMLWRDTIPPHRWQTIGWMRLWYSCPWYREDRNLVILKGPFPHQPFYDFIPSCIFSRLKRLFLWYFRARKAATIARIEAFFAPDQILIHVPWMRMSRTSQITLTSSLELWIASLTLL